MRIGVDGPRRARRRLPEDARGAVLLSRADSRQHRGGGVHRRPAPDDCGLRRSPRRRPADARRRAVVWRRRLRRHAGRRRAAAARSIRGRARPSRRSCRGCRCCRRAPGRRTRPRRSPPARRRRPRAGATCRRPRASTRRSPPKPAATVLLTGTDERGRSQPVLTWHQYGRGKAVALTPAGHVAVADARQHPARGSDPRELLAADAAVARRRRARRRRGADDAATASSRARR